MAELKSGTEAIRVCNFRSTRMPHFLRSLRKVSASHSNRLDSSRFQMMDTASHFSQKREKWRSNISPTILRAQQNISVHSR